MSRVSGNLYCIACLKFSTDFSLMWEWGMANGFDVASVSYSLVITAQHMSSDKRCQKRFWFKNNHHLPLETKYVCTL